MNHKRTSSIFTLLVSTSAVVGAPGCYSGDDPLASASATDGSGESGAPETTGDDEPTGTAASGDATGAGEETGDDTGAAPVTCDDAPVSAGASPLRRLTRYEYINSVRDMLGDDELAVEVEIVDSRSGSGFLANDVAVDRGGVENYIAAAEGLASALVGEKRTLWTDCALADRACVQDSLLALAGRAFRRALAADEAAAITALYTSAVETWGVDDGAATALEAVFSSPNFLYHREAGEPAPDDPALTRLTAYELASRMSYFLWQSLPDAELLAAAASDALHDPAEREAQARRMLASPKFTRAVGQFHVEWLLLDEKLVDVYKDPGLYPEWGPALETAMVKEVRKFAVHVLTVDDARVSTLLTAPYTFVNPALAELYGVEAPETGFVKTDTDPGTQLGLLARGAFLTANAHDTSGSWAQRGHFVRTRMLCEFVPPPPGNVEIVPENQPNRLINPECSGCHTLMDPIGQGFDNYDAIGRFDLLDGPAGGSVEGAPENDAVGEFAGLAELAARLADSKTVRDCMTRQWFRYATRRAEEKADKCAVQDLAEQFAAADGDMRELAVAITLSDGFRYLGGR